MAAWVYILRCADGSYYTGCTTDLDARWGQHEAGVYDGYTAMRRPLELVWADEFQSLWDAIDAERRIKGWSRLKKEALILRDYDRLPDLSKRGFKPRCVVRDASLTRRSSP
jgi:predicted GIY-YIG superfamily endonuclease